MDKTRLYLFFFHCLAVIIVIMMGICAALLLHRFINIMQWSSSDKAVSVKQTYQRICLDPSRLYVEYNSEHAHNLYYDWFLECVKSRKCRAMGNNWHHIIPVTIFCFVNIILAIFIIQASVCFCKQRKGCQLVVWLFGMILLNIMQVNNLSSVWLTAKFRFSAAGELCSELDWASAFDPETERLTDTWTYAKDGLLIKAVWIVQLVTFPLVCAFGCLSIPATNKIQSLQKHSPEE